MARRSFPYTDIQTEGRRNQALVDRITALEQAQSASTAITVTIPEPHEPFTVVYAPNKGGVIAYLPIDLPNNAATLVISCIKTSDRDTDAHFSNRKIHSVEYQIDDDQRAAGYGEFPFPSQKGYLDYNTQFDLLRLRAFDANGNRLFNPTEDPARADSPLEQFTTPAAFNAPSAPNALLIVYNELDPTTPDIYDAHAGLKVYAPLTDAGAAQAWSAVFAGSVPIVQAVLTRDYGGTTGIQKIPYPHVLTDVELTQTDPASSPANRGYVVIDANKLVPGAPYVWTKNAISVNGEDAVATGSVSFNGAGFQVDITQLSNVTIGVRATDPFDGKHVQPYLEFTQPATFVALRNFTVKLKKSTDTDYNNQVDRDSRVQGDAYHRQHNAGTIQITSGTKSVVGTGTQFTRLQEGWRIKVGAQTLTIGTITDDTHLTVTANSSASASGQSYTVVCVVPLMDSMKVKPSTTYNLQVILRARQQNTTTLNLTFSTDADGNIIADTDVPSGLSAISFARVKKNGTHLQIPKPTTNVNSFESAFVVVGSAYPPANGVKVLTAADLTTTTTLSSASDVAGRIGSGRKKTTIEIDKAQLESLFGASATIHFWWYAVNSIGTSLISPDLSYNLATGETSSATDDSAAPGGTLTAPTVRKLKQAGLRITLTPPTTGNLKLRRANVYVANGNHSTATLWLSASDLTSSTGTESSGAIECPPSGGHTITASRTTLESIFGASATITVYATWTNDIGTSGFSTGSTYNLAIGEAGAVGSDTAAPTLASPSAPAVQERDGHIFVTPPDPTANKNTWDATQVIMSTQNTAPAGDPTVGSEGVQKIKGKGETFAPKRPQDVDLYFYYRHHNLFNGSAYSSWSTGTTLTVANITRPLQDFIGSAVPTHSEGLVYNNNSGTGHTTTTFVLDSGASSTDSFYVGMALHIASPGTSSPDNDRWRTITAYVGSTRTATVDTAYSSAPSGSLAFDIHRIGITGDRATKSGSGHGTTTFVLDSGASSTDNFYQGYTLYVPAADLGKRIRKVQSYVGSTRTLTLDGNIGSPANGIAYLIVNGSVGFPTPLQTNSGDASYRTGIASPVPFRWYLDGSTDQVVFQVLPPTDEGISLEHFQIQAHRANAGAALKADSGAVPIVSGLGYSYPASTGAPFAATIRFHNLYRGSGSDGWSSYAYHVEMPQSTTAGGSPNNDPEVFGTAKVIDYEGPSSYPTKISVY